MLAGDFLVMSATLMAIKSRSLLPKEDVDLEEDLDPRDELIERLIEYRRFKHAAEGLDDLRLLQISPFDEMGTPLQLIKEFGTRADFERAVRELQAALYKAAA